MADRADPPNPPLPRATCRLGQFATVSNEDNVKYSAAIMMLITMTIKIIMKVIILIKNIYTCTCMLFFSPKHTNYD